MTRAWVVLLCGVLAACKLEADLVECGDLLCPSDSVCLPDGCASAGDVAACEGLAENGMCSTAAVAVGYCTSGVCRGVFCGDGKMGFREVCDDGNVSAGDGCSSDCRSNEACGNGLVDGISHEECDNGVFGLSADGCTSRCTVEFPSWRDVTPQSIPAIGGPMAYDLRRDRMVVLDGATTWELDPNSEIWLRRSPAISPSQRNGATMAYEAVHGRTILFGGDATVPYGSETWAYDGITWTQLPLAVHPPGRTYAAMAFDRVRGKLVLFGGLGDLTQPQGLWRDTWEFDGATWAPKPTAHAPSARDWHAMTYDPVRQRIILFGGRDTSARADTWEFDGLDWTPRTITSPLPPPRDLTALAYHEAFDGLVMFGGRGATTNALADLWVLQDATWTPVNPATHPVARAGHGMAFHANSDRVIMFGGSGQPDTWAYNGGDWAAIATEPRPRSRYTPVLVYDPLRGAALMFGGGWSDYFVLGDTWELANGSWQKRMPAHSPPARSYSSGAYDSKRHRIVVFGGSKGETGDLDDTWTYDGTDWTQVTTATIPPARHSHRLAYDRRRDRIILFGGSDEVDVRNDTYEFDGTDWSLITSPVSPPGRTEFGMAYDDRRDRVVVHGGYMLTDTWELDGDVWQLAPTMPPSNSNQVVNDMVFDPQRQRIEALLGADLWEYDGTTWSPVQTPNVAPGRYACSMYYDAMNQRLARYGDGYNDDVWAMAYQSASIPKDRCAPGIDSDGDGAIGCGDASHPADPDCWGRCNPLCPPGTTCDTESPRCGDGACNAVLEDYVSCPGDCPP
ncbi:MAG: hypothetical protein IPQ07_24890 [Myxococcales bacterium]|nr:hypothetical protein [Myxococcales bacterium]